MTNKKDACEHDWRSRVPGENEIGCRCVKCKTVLAFGAAVISPPPEIVVEGLR